MVLYSFLVSEKSGIALSQRPMIKKIYRFCCGTDELSFLFKTIKKKRDQFCYGGMHGHIKESSIFLRLLVHSKNLRVEKFYRISVLFPSGSATVMHEVFGGCLEIFCMESEKCGAEV
jgi:hypothetical protein